MFIKRFKNKRSVLPKVTLVYFNASDVYRSKLKVYLLYVDLLYHFYAINLVNMPKLIRLEDSTYKELSHYGHWEDTMDSIVRRLLQEAQLKKHENKEEVVVAK